VVVRYDGVPITQEIVLGPGFTIEAGFIHTDDGAIVAGQPEVAASWFPVNDHPIDKASYTFVVTAPAGLEVVANGRLLGRKGHGAKRTWLWHAPEPMASYLATVNIGQFDTRRYRTPDGLWMYDALDPDLFTEPVGGPGSPTFGEIADGSFARQAEIIDFLEERFSRYPFSTGGGIVDDYDNLQFALETQTRSVYSKLFFTEPESGDSVVVHEIAHQWFGDSVALAEWKHIWLNEGFAQYSEWMWSEEQGLGTAQELFDAFYNGIPANDPFWDVVIGDPGPQLLFDGAVYVRGAMTVHQLRLEVGDRDFFRILRAWTTRRAGGHGTIPQFIRLAERISGEQLDELFRVWLFTGSKPALEGAAAAELERMRR
jgi:aminopeptidase N